jgi:hypothetical protein
MPLSPFHIDWLLLLSGAATVGIPTALLLYSVKRMRDLAGPHLELEPQHVVNVVLAFPTTAASLQSLEFLVRRADFRSPQTRREELRKLKTWLADQDLSRGDGFSMVLRQSIKDQGAVGPGLVAERLAEAQIKRMEMPNSRNGSPAPPGGAEWCVIGLAAALAASVAETFPASAGLSAACQGHDALTAATEKGVAMDAFYLFYSPAPEQRLTEDDARVLTADLQALLPRTS